MGLQNQFQDMHPMHPSYPFHAPEVVNEYNMLNDFLNTSLLEDGLTLGNLSQGICAPVPPQISGVSGLDTMVSLQAPRQATFDLGATVQADTVPTRTASTAPIDKAQEAYYLTAADPAGSDAPDARMNKLLKAKHDAGLLRPFNYVKGYARLNRYMEQHMQPSSKQKILRQLDKFRPKFRERMQRLTDMELVLVEMWFERCLMKYDRVFASMAIPACCWRRTGEVFRGNKEMAELIDVSIDKLKDV